MATDPGELTLKVRGICASTRNCNSGNFLVAFAINGSIMVADLRSRPSNGAKMFNVVRNSEWKSSKDIKSPRNKNSLSGDCTSPVIRNVSVVKRCESVVKKSPISRS